MEHQKPGSIRPGPWEHTKTGQCRTRVHALGVLPLLDSLQVRMNHKLWYLWLFQLNSHSLNCVFAQFESQTCNASCVEQKMCVSFCTRVQPNWWDGGALLFVLLSLSDKLQVSFGLYIQRLMKDGEVGICEITFPVSPHSPRESLLSRTWRFPKIA